MNKEKRFGGFKKRNFIVKVSEHYHEQPKTDKHGEITMCILKVALPLKGIMLGALVPKVLDKVTKAFPEVKFNFNPNAEAFIISATGKAVCSEGDIFDETIGRRIAYAKAQGKVYSTCSRIVKVVKEVYISTAEHNQHVQDFLEMLSRREKSYVKSKL